MKFTTLLCTHTIFSPRKKSGYAKWKPKIECWINSTYSNCKHIDVKKKTLNLKKSKSIIIDRLFVQNFFHPRHVSSDIGKYQIFIQVAFNLFVGFPRHYYGDDSSDPPATIDVHVKSVASVVIARTCSISWSCQNNIEIQWRKYVAESADLF